MFKVEHRCAANEHGRLDVLDWGCGSGVAGRRVVRWLDADRVTALRVWDHSALAADFAAEAAQARYPRLTVEQVTPGFLASDEPIGVLVVSHVLNELPAEVLQQLRGLVDSDAATELLFEH